MINPHQSMRSEGLGPRLTERQRQVLDVLSSDWQSAWEIANAAKITTSSPSETASKFADQLVKLALAEKGGQRSAPTWRRKIEI